MKPGDVISNFEIGHSWLKGLPNGKRYTYFAEETDSYWEVSLGEVADLGQRISKGVSDAYSHWCAETPAKEVS